MTEIERMKKDHDEVIVRCRDIIAMHLDAEAFEPPSMTINLPEHFRSMARRRAKAAIEANNLLTDILLILDQEYAVYYTGKSAVPQA